MQELKIFEEKQIRTIWDEVQEKWYFSIVDIVQILTESKDYLTARKYWNKLKQRLLAEGNETVTNCHQLKLRAADGKLRYSDVADLEQMLRLIQSIPSPKAEPFKRWLAQVGAERIQQMQDPELGIQQSLMDYKRLGYSDNWINQRLKSIEIRKDLTDQWKAHNVEEGVGYATLTDIIYQAWAGLTAREYKHLKGRTPSDNERTRTYCSERWIGCKSGEGSLRRADRKESRKFTQYETVSRIPAN